MNVAELNKILKERKIIIGAKRCVKELKKGSIEQVIFSVDLPPELKKKIEAEAKNAKNIEIVQLDKTKEELAELCKKPFNISVISVLKKW